MIWSLTCPALPKKKKHTQIELFSNFEIKHEVLKCSLNSGRALKNELRNKKFR